MTYGTLLLSLDGSMHLHARIDAAIDLARRHASHLVGLAATGTLPFEGTLGAGLLARDQLSGALAAANRLAQARAGTFAERVERSTLRSHEVVIDDRDAAVALAHRGLHSDLVVLGQPDPAEPDAPLRRGEFERTLSNLTAPAIVLPARLPKAGFGHRVLVAWKADCACARAVAAALPILRKAGQVHVVHADSPFEEIDGAPPAVDLELARARLARDGVNASTGLVESSASAGDAVLAEIERTGSDLVVMGAWGRPRWSEQVFGGCTRTLLARMPVPLFVAR